MNVFSHFSGAIVLLLYNGQLWSLWNTRNSMGYDWYPGAADEIE